MAKTNLNFHMTFKPERQYLSSVLSEAACCSGMDIQEISNQTGIPTGASSGKVEPTLCYADYMGLINKEKKDGKYVLALTPVGECIKLEDGGLLEKLTLMLLHCFLVRPYSGAELWAYVFHGVFPKYRNRVTVKQFEKEIELQFGAGVKMAPFNGTYQELLAPLGILEVDESGIELRASKVDADFVYLYALTLYVYWDEWLKCSDDVSVNTASDSEITAEHLKQIGFRNPFGWSDKEEYQALELMASKGLIVLNRQMVPFTVRRCSDLESVIEMLYSELC